MRMQLNAALGIAVQHLKQDKASASREQVCLQALQPGLLIMHDPGLTAGTTLAVCWCSCLRCSLGSLTWVRQWPPL